MTTFFNDIKFGLRTLRKNLGFTMLAVMTLALGIAVNAVFTTIGNDLFFRPLTAEAPNRLVVIANTAPSIPYQIPYSYADAQDFRRFVEGSDTVVPDMAKVFAGLLAYKEQTVHLSHTESTTERTWIHAATDNYFKVLGTQPHLGRFFLPSEAAAPGSEPVMVLTYDTWRSRFLAEPSIVGRAVKLNGIPFTVIGVTRPGFTGASFGADLCGFVPVTMLTRLLPNGEHWALKRGNTSCFMVGRMHPGVTVSQAQAACRVALARIMQDHPGNHMPQTQAVVMKERHSRPSPYISHHTPKIMIVLTALGFLVLVVALANTAGLLYSRSTSQQRSLAIRTAIGASRFHIIRQLLTESTLMALLAGGIGMLLAQGLTPALLALIPPPPTAPPAAESGLDWRPVVATLLVALAAGFSAGLLPALKASGIAPLNFLRPSGAELRSSRHHLRRVLIVGQVAVSTLVLVGGVLALRSVILLSQSDLGFRKDHLYLASFDIGAQHYNEEQGQQFYTDLVARLRTLPGIEAASLTTGAPLDTAMSMLGGIRPFDGPQAQAEQLPSIFTISVEHDYLATIGLPLLRGRTFTQHDDNEAPNVAIINAAFASLYWPDRPALGQQLSVRGRKTEVIGVTGSTCYFNAQENQRPILILPLTQHYRSAATLVVRTTKAAPSPLAAIANTVQTLDPDLPLFDRRSMQQQIAYSPNGLMPFRIGAIFASLQGGIVLLLSGAGIFGLVAFNVTRRTREIGIRLALGSPTLAVIKEVTRECIILTAIGLTTGLILAFALARLLGNLLYGSGQWDSLVFGSVTLVIVLTVTAACWFPTRRALRVDPMETLRYE